MASVGAFDLESVTYDLEDPANRILSASLYGDLHPDGWAVSLDDERELIERFLTEARRYDGLLGWNIDEFDLPLLVRQARACRAHMSILPVTLDAMRVHYHMLRKVEVSDALGYVAGRHLGEGKLPIDHRNMTKAFETDREALKAYNIQDSRLVYLLDRKFGYWATFSAIVERAGLDDRGARAFAAPSSMKENGSFAWWRPIYGLVTARCRRLGVSPPAWPTESEKRLRREVEDRPGAFIADPVRGHHKCVMEFDFRSLYPSIVQSFNLGYGDTNDPQGEVVCPTGRYTSKRRSVMAGILDELVEERAQVRREHDAAPTPALKGRLEALKIFSNAMYGQLYAPFSPFYNYQSARDVTMIGQELIREMLRRIAEMGLQVIAAHTDSTYIKVPPGLFDEAGGRRLGRELEEHMYAYVAARYGVEFRGAFEFRGLLSDLAVYSKTQYARLEAGRPLSEMELRGYLRSNTPPLHRDLQRRVFEALFRGEDPLAMLAAEKEAFLSRRDHTGLLAWVRAVSKAPGTAPERARASLARLVPLGRLEQVGYLISSDGDREFRYAAHLLPDGRAEWAMEGLDALSTDREILRPRQAELAWDETVRRLDGLPRHPAPTAAMTLEEFFA